MNKYLYKNHWLFLLLFITACVDAYKSAKTQNQKAFSVLGLGDSITEGGAGFDSYLFPLDSMLKASGCQTSFIGPRQTVHVNDTLHHAGFSGKTAEYIAQKIDSIYSAFPATVVLLHSGHNHFLEEQPIKGIILAQEKIITIITKKNPKAFIFVAAVITSGKLPKYEYIPELNKEIKKMVQSKRNNHVVFVDQQQGWDWTQNTIPDKVHPNQKGAICLANNWFIAINKYLNRYE